MQAPLVAVIIPAFNVAATIDETLRSVREQSYRNLEIIIVDDGSTDATPHIAAAHAREDPRIRVVRQKNGGLSAARNRGVAEASAGFIATVDADDLWRPSKIEKQMATMLREGPRVGLVYTWQARVDHLGRILTQQKLPHRLEKGPPLPNLFVSNFVGSGSTPLVRRQAMVEAGCYDVTLREGCEDLALYLRIGERYEFGVVPECLVGYRQMPTSMSRNYLRMVRSRDHVMSDFRAAYPQYERELREGYIRACQRNYERALDEFQVRAAAAVIAELFRSAPAHAMLLAVAAPVIMSLQLAKRAMRAARFAMARRSGSDEVWFLKPSVSPRPDRAPLGKFGASHSRQSKPRAQTKDKRRV